MLISDRSVEKDRLLPNASKIARPSPSPHHHHLHKHNPFLYKSLLLSISHYILFDFLSLSRDKSLSFSLSLTSSLFSQYLNLCLCFFFPSLEKVSALFCSRSRSWFALVVFGNPRNSTSVVVRVGCSGPGWRSCSS